MIYNVFFKGIFIGKVYATAKEVATIEKEGFVLKYEHKTKTEIE